MSFNKCVCNMIFIFLLLPILPSTTYADLRGDGPSHFVGSDIGKAYLNLSKNYGGSIFRKNIISFNLFAGLNLDEYFGLEVGFQRDNRRRIIRTLGEGGHVPGSTRVNNLVSPVVFDTYIKFRSAYLGLTGNYPIFENVSITSLLGVSRVSIQATHSMLSIAGITHHIETIENMFYDRTYQKSKFVPMVRIGIKHQIEKNVALRAGATWVGAANIKIDSNENGKFRWSTNSYIPNNRIQVKSSVSFLAGVVVTLP